MGHTEYDHKGLCFIQSANFFHEINACNAIVHNVIYIFFTERDKTGFGRRCKLEACC